MNISTSEYCSSGCESGWTMYLMNQPSSSLKDGGGKIVSEGCRRKAANADEEYDEEDDEDLSMVSDASSGPPQFQEDEDWVDETRYFCYGSLVSEQPNKRQIKEKKLREERNEKKQLCSLDDTASSPIKASSSKKHTAIPPSGASSMEHTTLGFSQGFSATHFKQGKSPLKKKFGFFHSVTGKPASGAKAEEEAGGLQGRKWE
ncbi:hypothetical protein U1Q18_005474 [Sarracenia purpurea var. burkii]